MPKILPANSIPVAFGLLICLTQSLVAQFPQARLWTVFPAGGQSASHVDVAITGQDLEGSVRLEFSDSRITASPKLNDKDESIKHEFVVEIPIEVSPGLYEVWTVGKFGMSNSRLFVVGGYEELVDRTPAHKRGSASPVRLGTTINGRTVANQKNHYRVFAQEGQRLIGACYGEAIDSRIEPVIELLDANGRSLQKDRRGRLIDYEVKTTGAYFVVVSDLTYRGGDQYFYRLSIHVDSHADYVLPLSVSSEKGQSFHVFGRNLPHGQASEFSMKSSGLSGFVVSSDHLVAQEEASLSLSGLKHSLPGSFGQQGFLLSTLRSKDGLGQLRLGRSGPRTMVESEMTSGDISSQLVELPVSISGMFYPKYDEDIFEFDAKKGEEYWVEVRSSRLGFGTSPMVLIERLEADTSRVKEKVAELTKPSRDIGERAFPLRSRDPQGLVKIKHDGRYRLTVSDLFNLTRDQVGRLYEVQIRKPSPGFRAYSLAQSSLHRNIARRAIVETSTLLPGQILPVRIKLDRNDGFRGEVTITSGAAPDGVRVHPLTIPGGSQDGILFIEADDEAKPVAGNLNLVATATIDGNETTASVEHGQVVWEVGDYNNDPVLSRVSPNRRLAIAGQQAFPVRLQTDKKDGKPWQTSVAGKLNIPIQLSRDAEFSEAYSFKVGGLKALAKHAGVTFSKGKESASLEIDLTKNALAPGLHEFYFYGEVKGEYRREQGADLKDLTISTYSPPILVEVFPAPFEIEIDGEISELKKGGSISIPIKLSRRFDFGGQIEVNSAFEKEAKGLKVTSSMLRNDRFDLTIEASDKSDSGVVSLELTAKGQLNGKSVIATKRVDLDVKASKG
jgi:hypothetical protein